LKNRLLASVVYLTTTFNISQYLTHRNLSIQLDSIIRINPTKASVHNPVALLSHSQTTRPSQASWQV